MKEGEAIGEVVDIFGNVVESVTAPFDGIIYTILDLPPVYAGDVISIVASFEGELFDAYQGYHGYRSASYKIVR